MRLTWRRFPLRPWRRLNASTTKKLRHRCINAGERLDDYDTTSAGRAIADFVEDISNWYVRRSRRRFWDGDEGAFFVLWRCLVDVSKLLAPLIPFVTDEIYDNLDGSEPSVHLCDYPEVESGLQVVYAQVTGRAAPSAAEEEEATRAERLAAGWERMLGTYGVCTPSGSRGDCMLVGWLRSKTRPCFTSPIAARRT